MTASANANPRRLHPRAIPILSPLGTVLISLFKFVGGLTELLFESVSGLFQIISECRIGPVERHAAMLDFLEIVRQMQIVSWGAFWIAIVTVSSSGMVIAMESVSQLQTFGLASTYLGGGVAYATVREMAPVLAAVVSTASVASSITAQIGSMKVTEQIDAIRAMGVSPVRYLVIPRVVAMTIMIPVLAVVADYCGIIGGFLIASGHEIALSTYVHSIYDVVSVMDFVGGLIKSFVFGVLISLTACLMGLRTRGGAAGVGRSTIQSVVTCIILIYLFDTLLTAVIWHG